ncbi:S26 family signal peptidase [Clostridioides sp. ZZV15-6597]|uniref:S26 family signal peptidase n=1 Tax=Clostridioides sp. ZZV15-6597 TaxID=2811500 RepID=UPI002105E903
MKKLSKKSFPLVFRYLKYILIVSLFLFLINNIITVKGNSMYPTIQEKDYLIINKLFKKNIRKGDIIVFNTYVKGLKKN